MIPIYFGVDDANEGLATGTENYWCVNKNASEADVKATLDIMNWCVTSEAGTKSMAEDMDSQFLSKRQRPQAMYL